MRYGKPKFVQPYAALVSKRTLPATPRHPKRSSSPPLMENKRRGRTRPLRNGKPRTNRFLLSSLTKEVKIQVSTCETAAAVWKAIEQMYASQTCARIVNIRIAFANLMYKMHFFMVILKKFRCNNHQVLVIKILF